MAVAIVIDPHLQTISRTVIDATNNSGLPDIYRATKCNCITTVRVDARNVMYLDDMGLYAEGQAFFAFDNYPQPLAGSAIIVGIGPEGETISTTLDEAHVKSKVTWHDNIEFAGLVTDEPRIENRFGRDFTVLASRARFRVKGSAK